MRIIKLLTLPLTTAFILFAGCRKNDFTEIPGVCPIVVSTIPVAGALNVPLNQIITITFNDEMDAATITAESILLSDGAPVLGTVTYSGLTATFTPSEPLTDNTTYTGRVKTSVKNLTGNYLQEDYVWSFSTGSTLLPLVISTNPQDNEMNVALDQTVTATFNQAMNEGSFDISTFTLYQGMTQISGAVNCTGAVASFDPAGDLLPNLLYTATITTGVTSALGDAMANQYQWTFTTINSKVPPVIDLGSVSAYGIISGVAVSNNAGPSEIHDMNIGIYPGVRSSITGFFEVDGGPGLIFNGLFLAADDAAPIPAALLQAKNDLTAAYLQAEGASLPAPVTISGDIGGQTLAPGIYKSTSTLLIQNGNLTLDAQGDPNASWIFQIASDFTTIGGSPFPSPAGGNVILAGGAQAKNIFWQVGSSATIGDYTSFKGTILALTSVTMNAYAQAVGRMLCSNGAVTLTSTNFIYKP